MKSPIFLISALGFCFAGSSLAACLDVNVATSPKAVNGKTVLVGLYRETDQFPTPGRHLVADKAVISNGKASIRFQNIPTGRYAIASGIDNNSNGKVDVNFLGIPSEPVAFSMKAKASMVGPPKFKDAAFEVKDGTVCTAVTISFE